MTKEVFQKFYNLFTNLVKQEVFAMINALCDRFGLAFEVRLYAGRLTIR